MGQLSEQGLEYVSLYWTDLSQIMAMTPAIDDTDRRLH